MTRRRALCQAVLSSVLVLLAAAALDAALRFLLIRRGVLNEVVDLRSASVVRAKIDYLKRFRGYKVVLLGDSLIYGHCLAEHGDRQWREHNLAPALARRIRHDRPDRPVLVMNLGLNGAVPADLECLAGLLDGCGVDLLVFDVSLRSFSADFVRPESRLSRPWLAELASPPPAAAADSVEMSLSGALLNCWAVYRYRDFLQVRFLGNSPREALADVRERAVDAWRPKSPHPATGLDDEMILLMKARARYQSIDLGPDHPQRAALERMLSHLARSGQQTVVFYAKENPDVVGDLLDGDRYSRLLAQLRRIVTQTGGTGGRVVPPLPELGPRRYLDHVHLNAEGYDLLAERLWRAAQAR
jgi:lysophospholipase L1-like esterase